MIRHRPPRRAIQTAAGLLAVVLVGLPGCDGSEIVGRVTAAIGGDEGVASPTADATRRDPEIESVGPDAAMRVYYQFVDDGGRVQFVERLSAVPAAWRDRVGYVEMSQPPPLTPEAARRSWSVSAQRTAEIMAGTVGSVRDGASVARGARGSAVVSEVVLYYADWCGYCRKAKSHLDGAGVVYEIRDADVPATKQELRQKTGRSGIPVLDMSGEILRGYSEAAYDRAIAALRG